MVDGKQHEILWNTKPCLFKTAIRLFDNFTQQRRIGPRWVKSAAIGTNGCKPGSLVTKEMN